MKRIILDTNILMAIAQFKIDLFSGIDRVCLFNYKLYIVDKTNDELKKIVKKQRGKNKKAAKLALSFLKLGRIDRIRSAKGSKDVDSIILEIANKEKDIIATQDILLKKQLKKRGLPVITLRQRKYLVLQQ